MEPALLFCLSFDWCNSTNSIHMYCLPSYISALVSFVFIINSTLINSINKKKSSLSLHKTQPSLNEHLSCQQVENGIHKFQKICRCNLYLCFSSFAWVYLERDMTSVDVLDKIRRIKWRQNCVDTKLILYVISSSSLPPYMEWPFLPWISYYPLIYRVFKKNWN